MSEVVEPGRILFDSTLIRISHTSTESEVIFMAMEEKEQASAEQDFAELLAWASTQANVEQIHAALELIGMALMGIRKRYPLEVSHLWIVVNAAEWVAGLAQDQGFEMQAWYFATVAQRFRSALDGYEK